VRVEVALVADYVAMTSDQKLIIGGVFDRILPPCLPYVHPSMGLALRIRFDIDEGHDHQVVVRFIDPDGAAVMPELVAQLGAPPDPAAEQVRTMQLALGMGDVPFKNEGPHRIDILIDGQYLDSVELAVTVRPTSPSENG
jgi:hypothetical protein